MTSLLITMFAVGCMVDGGDSGQSGEENAGAMCDAVATTDYAFADSTPLGFTGQQVADLVVAEHAATLTWAKGGETALTVAVTTAATAITWRDNGYVDDGSGIEIAMECADDLMLPVQAVFTTADGAFAETWDLELSAVAADAASAYAELDLDALGGTYTVTEVDPADFDAVRAFLELKIGPGGASGEVSGQAEEAGDAADPDSTASASRFEIATF